MYIRLLRKSAHIKKFSVTYQQPHGWVVHEEEDSQVVVAVRYRDWHRVERAIRAFANKARHFVSAGGPTTRSSITAVLFAPLFATAA